MPSTLGPAMACDLSRSPSHHVEIAVRCLVGLVLGGAEIRERLCSSLVGQLHGVEVIDGLMHFASGGLNVIRAGGLFHPHILPDHAGAAPFMAVGCSVTLQQARRRQAAVIPVQHGARTGRRRAAPQARVRLCTLICLPCRTSLLYQRQERPRFPRHFFFCPSYGKRRSTIDRVAGLRLRRDDRVEMVVALVLLGRRAAVRARRGLPLLDDADRALLHRLGARLLLLLAVLPAHDLLHADLGLRAALAEPGHGVDAFGARGITETSRYRGLAGARTARATRMVC